MLVLTRKKGESIMLGEDIEVVVLGVDGDSLKLGIKAPKHVDIYRKEIYNAIQLSNQEAVARTVDWKQLGNWLDKKE